MATEASAFAAPCALPVTVLSRATSASTDAPSANWIPVAFPVSRFDLTCTPEFTP